MHQLVNINIYTHRTVLWNFGIYQTTGCLSVIDRRHKLWNSIVFRERNFLFSCSIKEAFLTFSEHPTAHRMYKQEICTFKIIPIKCSKITISYLHQLINKLWKLPFCSYFPPLPLDVTNFKKLLERKTVLYLV